MAPLPTSTFGMDIKDIVLISTVLTKAIKKMGPKRFRRQNFSLFIVKFKKLGFTAN